MSQLNFDPIFDDLLDICDQGEPEEGEEEFCSLPVMATKPC